MVSPLPPGSMLDGGKYRIVRLLGEGGMGSVFQAEHTVTHKHVAIKTMRHEVAAKPNAADRLIREARAAARIRHPNVVDVYDVGRDGDVIFLVMEYLEGEVLSELLARGGLPLHQSIRLLTAAMKGVAAAHRQGVIHRDLKPDNIFLARVEDAATPVPKVLDFGISKLEARGAEPLYLTRSGSALGTPVYMPLEQLNGQKDVDARADVYALGVILYEALTGRLPYQAEAYTELIIKVVSGPPTPPKQLRPELPESLSRIAMWALAHERNDRLQNVDALIRELEPFANESGFRAEMTLADAPLPMLLARSEAKGGEAVDAHDSTALATGLRGSKWPGARIPLSARAARLGRRPAIAGGLILLLAFGIWSFTRGTPATGASGSAVRPPSRPSAAAPHMRMAAPATSPTTSAEARSASALPVQAAGATAPVQPARPLQPEAAARRADPQPAPAEDLGGRAPPAKAARVQVTKARRVVTRNPAAEPEREATNGAPRAEPLESAKKGVSATDGPRFRVSLPVAEDFY